MDEMIKQIEEKRLAFLAFYKKYRSGNTILMMIFIVSFIPVMLWIMPIPQFGTYIALGIVVAFVVVLFLYGNSMKKRTTNATLAYIDQYYQTIDNYVFDAVNMKDYYQFTDEQIDLELVKSARIIKDVDDCASRNTVKYYFNSTNIHTADLVAYVHIEVKKKMEKRGMFYGKLMLAGNQQKDDSRTIIYLKPKIEIAATAVGPTDIDDLTKVHDDSEFAIYTSANNLDSVLTKDALNLLQNFPLNEDLIDATISLQKGQTAFALSFSERIMIIPYNQAANAEAIEHLKEAVGVCHKFLQTNR